MKKIISLVLIFVMMLSLVACSSDDNETKDESAAKDTAGTVLGSDDENKKPETITVTCLDGNSETTEITVPYDPQRIAVLDFASLDILDNLGLGDRIVGCSSINASVEYLQSYSDKEGVANLGTIKEADMEAIMLSEPDIIFMAGRMSDYYDELSEIAPVVRLTTDSSLGLVESVRKNAKTIASIFGLDDEIDSKLAEYDSRIAALAEAAEGKTAVVGMFSGGSFSTLGNDGRCSIIGTEIGFENVGVSEDTATATHGNEVSYEFIVSANPDYIFVMNRDGAIGSDGADLAKDVIENELVKQTDAYNNGNIVYLEHPGIWYTAEGGITALGIMLEDLEAVLLD